MSDNNINDNNMKDMDYNDKNYLNKSYKNFSELVYIVSTKELQYFITKGEFTSFFNYRMKKKLSEISQQKNDNEKSSNFQAGVFFDTDGLITLIDAEIVGKFIEENYNIKMLEYYKSNSLNKIIREIVNGSEKAKGDFILISYSILYNTLNELYKTISCKKDNAIVYKNRFYLEDYKEDDCTIIIAVLLILEDLCKYIGVGRHKMVNQIKVKIYK